MDQGRITLTGKNHLSRVIPVDSRGYFYINWPITKDDSRLSTRPFDRLLEQDHDSQAGSTNSLEEVFKNKTVVIGSTASGNDLTDRGATPLEGDTVLVSKHWNVANSIITNQFVRRAGLGVELSLICLLGVFTAVITAKLRTLYAALSIFSLVAIYITLTFVVFTETRYWLPVIGAHLVMYVTETTYLVIFQDAEKRRVKGVFSKMVSPEVVNELLSLKHLSLGGARRTITVMFADIRGFTTLTDQNRERAAEFIKQHGLTGEAAEAVEDKSATDTLDIVNKYLAVVAEQVILNQGTVDKFIGDCVMAFWGAPLANNQHALGAVRAAIGAQRAIFDLNGRHEEENRGIEAQNLMLAAEGKPLLPPKPTLSMGSGINTGAVTAGLMGWEDHSISYTVFGREVNVASRLEGVSGHGRIIISEATLAQLLNHDNELAMSCVPLEAVNVKGIKDKVPIYEVPWRTGKYAAAPSAPASATDTTMLTAAVPDKGH